MNSLLPIAASCLLAGGAIGYIVGDSGQDSSAAESVAEKEKSRAAGSSRAFGRSGSGSGSSSAKGSGSGKPSNYGEVSNVPGQTARVQALVDLYSNMTSEELKEEAKRLDGLPMGERFLAGSLLYAAWAEVSPYDAMDHANGQRGWASMMIKPGILQSWAASDPKGAADYYITNKSEFAGMGMMGRMGGGTGGATVAKEWAKQDPEGALTWAKGLEGRDGSDATARVLAQIAETDPERAASLTVGLEGDALASANENIAKEWAKKDWGEAESFINGLPADQRGDALGAAVRSLANENPTLAARKALEIPEGDSRDDAIESVAASLSREDPAKAAEWVVENGSEKAQRDSMRNVIGNWVDQDPTAAKEWAVGQPEGAVRDSAVSSFVMSDKNGSPQENIQLAETITDERSRGWSIGMTTMRWMGEDPEAASSYLETSEYIDEGMKKRILGRGGR
ncbi:MAG: hypothetical protein ABF379_12205 [Akkermansiaceae bacterium]